MRLRLLAKQDFPSLGSDEMTVVLVWLHGETASNCCSFGYTLKKIILVLSIPVYFWMTASESLRSAMISSSESLGVSNLGIMP